MSPRDSKGPKGGLVIYLKREEIYLRENSLDI